MTEHAIPGDKPTGLASPRTLFAVDALTCLVMGLLLVSFPGRSPRSSACREDCCPSPAWCCCRAPR